MANPKPRNNLSKKTARELKEIRLKLSGPASILKLLDEVLLPHECRLVGRAGIDRPALPKNRVSVAKILQVVAKQRRMSLERALLELGRESDHISQGKYESLRRAIGEPVTSQGDSMTNADRSPTTPSWDRSDGSLYLSGKAIGKFQIRKIPSRYQRIVDAFEKAHWQSTIAQPFGNKGSEEYVNSAVHDLNAQLVKIEFHVQCRGDEITWAFRKSK